MNIDFQLPIDTIRQTTALKCQSKNVMLRVMSVTMPNETEWTALISAANLVDASSGLQTIQVIAERCRPLTEDVA